MSNMDTTNHFGWIDYIIVGLTLLFSVLIGGYFVRGNTNNDELLLGGRKVSMWPVAASIMASYISAVTIIGYPAEVFAYGTEIFNMQLVSCIVFPISTFIIVPMFYSLRLTSLFEYLEHRFSCSTVRKMTSSVYIFEQLVLAGVILYGPSLVLTTFLGMPQWLSIVGIGIIATVYTSVGGLKAVVWTDAFQAIMMMLGMLAILIKGFLVSGGIYSAFELAKDTGRLNTLNFNVDIFERHNLFNFMVGFGLQSFLRTSLHQQQIQRYSSQPTLDHAMKSMLLSVPITLCVKIIGVLTGLSLLAVYYGCDPTKTHEIASVDHILPYFVINHMKNVPGMLGLFTSCAFSGVLSSISSSINSLTAVTWEDFFKPIPKFAQMSPGSQANVSRALGIGYGIISICLAFSAQYMGSVYVASYQATGATIGVVGGTFLSGLFLPFINKHGAKFGIVVSFVSMIAIGGFSIFTKALHKIPLPTTTDFCPIGMGNVTTIYSTDFVQDPPELEWPKKLFSLSYLMYPLTGVTIFMIVATIVSGLTGGFKEKSRLSINQAYLHPWIRRKELSLNLQNFELNGPVKQC